jgi:hypothetical protein
MNFAKAFIELCFPDSGEPYKQKWYISFAKGTEWCDADFSHRKVLQKLAPDVYPKDLDAYFIYESSEFNLNKL